MLGIFGVSAVDAEQDTGEAVAVSVSPSPVSSVAGPSARVVAEVTDDATPQKPAGGVEVKPALTLPCFDPFSIESPAGPKLDARLKWRLARLKMEQEEKREE